MKRTPTTLVAKLILFFAFAPWSCWSLPIGGGIADQDITNAAQQQRQLVISQPEYEIDARQFAQFLSTHLLFDHLDTAFSHVSQEISQQFQSRIQVDATGDQYCSPVDVHILKGQLKGAVGSFIQDHLPSVWSKHASGLDKYTLQRYIQEQILDICPAAATANAADASPPSAPPSPEQDIVSVSSLSISSSSSTVVRYACLANRSTDLFSALDVYLANQLKTALSTVFEKELPALFETTQAHVATTLTHFNQNTLAASQCQLRLGSSDEDHNTKSWDDLLEKITQLAGHSDKPSSIEPSLSQFATLAKLS